METFFILLLVWVMICTLTQLTLFIIFNTKCQIKITLPTPKKLKGKKSPIYELRKRYSDGGYDIFKWELSYDDDMGWNLWFIILLPYPIIFRRLKYMEVGGYNSHKDLQGRDGIREDIGVLYERLHEQHMKEMERDNESKSSEKNKLNEINKEFNENYVD
jgi:hypothetical protein